MPGRTGVGLGSLLARKGDGQPLFFPVALRPPSSYCYKGGDADHRFTWGVNRTVIQFHNIRGISSLVLAVCVVAQQVAAPLMAGALQRPLRSVGTGEGAGCDIPATASFECPGCGCCRVAKVGDKCGCCGSRRTDRLRASASRKTQSVGHGCCNGVTGVRRSGGGNETPNGLVGRLASPAIAVLPGATDQVRAALAVLGIRVVAERPAASSCVASRCRCGGRSAPEMPTGVCPVVRSHWRAERAAENSQLSWVVGTTSKVRPSIPGVDGVAYSRLTGLLIHASLCVWRL